MGAADAGSKVFDRRPSMILVTGYPDNCNKDDLISHFRKFGDILETSGLEVATVNHNNWDQMLKLMFSELQINHIKV